jgi:hypothetical protein
MLLLDQAATVSWADMSQMRPVRPGVALTTHSRNKDFESVRNAVLFIMETLDKGSRTSALIHTDGATLHYADIEAIYAKIKQS